MPSGGSSSRTAAPSAPVMVARDRLEDWTVTILRHVGASPEAARATAWALVDANVRGLHSHGVVFLSFYLPRLRAGTTRGDAEPEVIVELPCAAVVDGHDGLGAYVATVATELCCHKAREGGVGLVAVRNSSHFGAASCYSGQATRHGCIGIVLSNSDPGMAPIGALAPVLGTNPLAIAAPEAGGIAPSLDIATSVVAQGKVILAQRAGEPIPADWAIGCDGSPTTDPTDALSNSMLPFGGHKGFGLAFMIDVLTGSLTGSATSPHIPGDPKAPVAQRAGHLFIAISVDALADRGDYEASLRDLAAHVHDAPRAAWAEPFLTPGEPETRARERSTDDGIPLAPESLALMHELGKRYGVPFGEVLEPS